MDKSIEISRIAKQISELTESDNALITMFLEHDEWGIALDTMCSILIENDIAISNALYESIIKIGKAMEMETSDWDMIRRL